MDDLTDENLRDLRRACDYAARTINCFSEQFSRWIRLEKRIESELRKRGAWIA